MGSRLEGRVAQTGAEHRVEERRSPVRQLQASSEAGKPLIFDFSPKKDARGTCPSAKFYLNRRTGDRRSLSSRRLFVWATRPFRFDPVSCAPFSCVRAARILLSRIVD
jgi:hypothetical protein